MMKLLTGGRGLSKNLLELLEKYKNVAFAVAWASFGTDVFKALVQNKAKIWRAVIGTHFYQTHPAVLDEFVGFDQVRFILQPQGIFHPKVYFFWDSSEWELVIGSANLTAGALGKNSELLLHVSCQEASAANLKDQILAQIDCYWNAGDSAEKSVSTYRRLWKVQQPMLRRVSGSYSGGSKAKAPAHTAIMSMSWREFYKSVQADPNHGFSERCELLESVRNAFAEYKHLNEMELGLRKTVAGLPNDYDNRWAWFGSMKGAGYFHQAVNDNNTHLSQALDLIPLEGAVTRDHYEAYISEFIRAFPNRRHGVGLASRLLTLKRPDYFVCFDSKNKIRLCKDFGIKQSDMTYERYWEDVVNRVTDSVWWNEPQPSDKRVRKVWSGRAAMLDAIFYQP